MSVPKPVVAKKVARQTNILLMIILDSDKNSM